jgi:hypothetical protein
VGKFFQALRAYPGRWVGVQIEYNPDFVNFLKTSLQLKAWDQSSRTWWTPESNEPLVTAEMVRRGLWDAEQARKFSANFYAHQKLGTKEEPYRILGLQMGAPRPMIDFAYTYWKRQYSMAGNTGTQLVEIEMAYQQILNDDAAGLAPPTGGA